MYAMQIFLSAFFFLLASSAGAQTTIKGDMISLKGTTLPSTCWPGQIRKSTTDSKIYVCGPGGTFQEVGSGAGGGSGINILSQVNFDAEAGSTTSWSESGGGTLDVTSTAANVANGSYAFSFDASANLDYAASTAVAIPSGLYGNNCLLEFYRKGFDTNVTALVHDGTNVIATQALTTTAGWVLERLNFVCPTSGSLHMRLLASADAAIGYFDQVHLGSATNVISESIQTEWATCTATGSWVSNTTYTCKERRIGDSAEYDITVSTSGAPTSAALTVTIPRTIDTSKLSGNGASNPFDLGTANPLDVGTNDYIGFVRYNSTTVVSVRYYTGSTTLGANVTQAAPFTFGSGDSVHLLFKVPISGWTALSSAVASNNQNWHVDANISGANPDLGTSDQASYIGIENGSLTLTNNSGINVLTAQIPCSTTNSPSGTTCSVGNESVGVSFTVPQAGDVRACASFTHSITAGTSGNIMTGFQIVETPSNAQTISAEGRSRVQSRSNQASAAYRFPHRVCGTFTFSSAGQKTLRLFYEQDVTATVTENTLKADATATEGQPDIHWEVYPINQTAPAPILVGSVTSAHTTALKIETANLNCDAGSAITSQLGSWVSSVGNISTGACAVTLASGFASAPYCWAEVTGAISTGFETSVTASSATAVSVDCEDDASNACTSFDFNLFCLGAR